MTHSPQYRIVLVGCGKMGTAMIQGWSKAKLLKHVDILDPDYESSAIHDAGVNLQSLFHVKQAADIDFTKTDIMILAVKPQIMDLVCAGLKEFIPESLPILSIAAGKDTEYFKAALSSNNPIIRTMPNTPAAIGKGITALYATPNVTEDQRIMAQDLMAAVGDVVWLEDEKLMDGVTALSGSGPAYLFYLIEAMASAGEKVGLSADQAMQLARQTIIGSAALAEDEADTSANVLRKNVTSEGGTTEAALNILMHGEFQKIMDLAVKAAFERSKELSKT